jgi:CHAT domain-containing protein
VQRVRQLFGNSMLLAGAKATKSAFQQNAGDYRVIHVATHGYFNRLNPLLSSLQLEPTGEDNGQLAVYEVLGLSLHADLVTLSACQTALGAGDFQDYPSGDEFVGLTSAFLTAGSKAVVATLWDVKDRSTAVFVESFYRNMRSQDVTSALTGAQRRMLASREYRHPFYWAAFINIQTQSSENTERKNIAGVRVKQTTAKSTD